MSKTSAWIDAFRLRTLPLSISGVVMGTFLSLSRGRFTWSIFLLAILTTLLLQILSNLANDYGDSVNGKDTPDRIGPQRMVQSGSISLTEMKIMIGLFSLMSLVSGVLLLSVSNIVLFSISFFVLLALGILAIWAALTYTIGKNPYGYSGWGDLSVFLFFGLFSVAGTCMLFSGDILPEIFLPAISVGAFSVGVLNLNNMRDYATDKANNKITLVVKLGVRPAKYYHFALLSLSILCALVYLWINLAGLYSYIFLLVLVPLALHIKRILAIEQAVLFDKELKKLALIALLFSVLFGLGINI